MRERVDPVEKAMREISSPATAESQAARLLLARKQKRACQAGTRVLIVPGGRHQRALGRLLAHGSWSAGYVRELSFSDTRHCPPDDELAGLMPTIIERVDALGIFAFDADRRAGRLRT
jgi:hypothetical protein